MHSTCLRRGILLEVEEVKTHRTKNEKQHMSPFEQVVAEGNERADKLVKDGAMLDGGEMAQRRPAPINKN